MAAFRPVSPPFGFDSTLRNNRDLLGQEMRRVERQDDDGDPSEERHASDKHAPERFIVEIEPHRQAADFLPVLQPVGLAQQQPSKSIVDRKSDERDE